MRVERAAGIEGMRRGDDDAYELVVQRYGGRMLATARRLLGNDEDARDAVQEAMLSAFRAVGRFEGGAQSAPGSTASWSTRP